MIQEGRADTRPAFERPLLEVLADMLPGPAVPGPAGPSLVAECVDAVHPVLAGRVRVRWRAAGLTEERWVPTLFGVTVRVGDRVLLTQPANFDEPVAMGVLDGFAERPKAPLRASHDLKVARDEAVRVAGADGRPLLEIVQEDHGPVVRLLDGDVNLEVAGGLRLDAQRIELHARRGGVEVRASDDVVVQGETIRLN
jgi:hypothetical protein